MAQTQVNPLTQEQENELLNTLKIRFENNMNRHNGIKWAAIKERLTAHPRKIKTLFEMEMTGGEPDVVGVDEMSGAYIFYDCSIESPKGRRSLCYDRKALDARKTNKPANCVLDMAAAMGVELLNEEEYQALQKLGKFDLKTSSWLKTPTEIRKHGGAIFGDFRYETVFIYHNGAESYYAARGFRSSLKV